MLSPHRRHESRHQRTMSANPFRKTITLRTSGQNDIVDITAHLQAAIEESGIADGVISAFVPHTTCGLTAMELEPGTEKDLKEFLEGWIPRDAPYHHNRTDYDKNGHAHLRASLLGPSITIPVADGKLLLGTWQTPVLVDCDDRPRSRQLVVTVMGSRAE